MLLTQLVMETGLTVVQFCNHKSHSLLIKSMILDIIPLPGKFLPFDCLKAEVFQLNLKYLHVKITVTMVTLNHEIIWSHELRKNGGQTSRF